MKLSIQVFESKIITRLTQVLIRVLICDQVLPSQDPIQNHGELGDKTDLRSALLSKHYKTTGPEVPFLDPKYYKIQPFKRISMGRGFVAAAFCTLYSNCSYDSTSQHNSKTLHSLFIKTRLEEMH